MAIQTNIPQGSVFLTALNTILVNVVDADGAAQVMTGWSLQFVVRDAQGNAVITKATGGGGITIGNGSGTDSRATVTLAVADTANIAQGGGQYTYTLWRTDGSNDLPLAYGGIHLTKVAAQS